MPNVQDLAMARAEADATQRLLEGALDTVSEGGPPPPLTLIVGLGAISVCERIKALAVQLDQATTVNRASE